MSPLVRACIASAVLAALGAAVGAELEPVPAATPRPGTSDPPKLGRPCPPGTLLDASVCVPAPEAAPAESAPPSVHQWQIYDRLPRRPERPSDYQRYRWPLPSVDSFAPSPFVSEDAALLDALLLGAPQGAPVKVAELEGQSGAAAVLYAGKLVGQSVVTEHKSALGQREQRYLVIYGNLERVRAKAGALVGTGSELGSVGNSATGHALGLHLEVRQVRHGVDARELRPEQMRQRAYTIACDARNVLRQIER